VHTAKWLPAGRHTSKLSAQKRLSKMVSSCGSRNVRIVGRSFTDHRKTPSVRNAGERRKRGDENDSRAFDLSVRIATLRLSDDFPVAFHSYQQTQSQHP
jgi:hypothetical protein